MKKADGWKRNSLCALVIIFIVCALYVLCGRESVTTDVGVVYPMIGLADANLTINEVWSPGTVGAGWVFRAFANLTANSTIQNLTCNLTGSNGFMILSGYSLSVNIGAVSNGTEIILNWTLASSKTLGYVTLNVTCSNATKINGAAARRLKIVRG